MYVQQFFVEGLGCASYLVGCEAAGVAAVVDPDREVQKYLGAAASRGLRITHIIETHLHADHVSGNTDLAGRTGADIYIHEAAKAEFAHKPLKEDDVIELGNIRMQVRHTPGHTPESITLLVTDTTRGNSPWLALTGDTLFVNDIGRPDLVGAKAARGLAQDMYSSLFDKILPLEDSLLIYPGHGAGSLCGKSIGAMRSTTLGYERQYNPALSPRDQSSFVEFATSNLPEQPGNHRRIKALNRRGPAPLGDVKPKPLSLHEAVRAFQRGAAMLDTRSKPDFVEKHVPGAVHLEADEQLPNKIGFVLPPDLPIVLVVEDQESYRQVVLSLARVGYDQELLGYLDVSLDEWQANGLPVTSGDIEDITPREAYSLIQNGNGSRPVVVDVREPWEFNQGHVPGSINIPLGSLANKSGSLDPKQPVIVICAHGNRSQSGAAFFGQKNFEKVYNVLGGTADWMRSGLPLEN